MLGRQFVDLRAGADHVSCHQNETVCDIRPLFDQFPEDRETVGAGHAQIAEDDVNLLTGERSEILDHAASHMDVNACIYCGNDSKELATVRTKASLNVKRVMTYDREDWTSPDAQSPYFILDTQGIKTTWHPVGT